MIKDLYITDIPLEESVIREVVKILGDESWFDEEYTNWVKKEESYLSYASGWGEYYSWLDISDEENLTKISYEDFMVKYGNKQPQQETSNKSLEERVLKLETLVESLMGDVKEEEFTYPIYKRSLSNGAIVKFSDLTVGEVLFQGGSIAKKGYKNDEFIKHTNKSCWQDVLYDSEQGFFDKQLVWCWDDEDYCKRDLRFYDAKNNCTFHYDGDRDGHDFDNYEAYEGDYPEWSIEAMKTLED